MATTSGKFCELTDFILTSADFILKTKHFWKMPSLTQDIKILVIFKVPKMFLITLLLLNTRLGIVFLFHLKTVVCKPQPSTCISPQLSPLQSSCEASEQNCRGNRPGQSSRRKSREGNQIKLRGRHSNCSTNKKKL